MIHLSHPLSYDHSKNYLGLTSCGLADGEQQFKEHTTHSITPGYSVAKPQGTQYKF